MIYILQIDAKRNHRIGINDLQLQNPSKSHSVPAEVKQHIAPPISYKNKAIADKKS